jgi:hypothetical protein
MIFFFFIINAHIEIYFNVRIVFLDVVYYKSLNTRLDIKLLVINPPKPTRGPRCTFIQNIACEIITSWLRNDDTKQGTK